MYLLARALTGRRDAAAAGGARATRFTPFRIAHLAHLQWLMTGWLPLSLWALHRYFSTGAFAFLLASAARLSAAEPDRELLHLLRAAAARRRRRSSSAGGRGRRCGGRVAHVDAAAALLRAVILAPIVAAYYRARADHDFVRKPAEIAALSADLGDYFRAHNHVALWRHARPGTGEHELFPGAIVLVLAGGGAARRARRRDRAHPALRRDRRRRRSCCRSVRSRRRGATCRRFAGPYQLLLEHGARPRRPALASPASRVIVVLARVRARRRSAPRGSSIACRPRAGRRSSPCWRSAIVADGWAAPIPTARFDPLANAGRS